MLTELESFLDDLRSNGAVVINDLLTGVSLGKITSDLEATKLRIPLEVIEFWRLVGGTRQPVGTDPQFKEKYRLDEAYIFYSPTEACADYCVIQDQKQKGFEDFYDLPNTCLPIARSIFGQYLCIECDLSSPFYGNIFHFDPPSAEHLRVSISLNQYFKTVGAAFKAKIMKLDHNAELDIQDFDSYFAMGVKMNPKCDYWLS